MQRQVRLKLRPAPGAPASTSFDPPADLGFDYIYESGRSGKLVSLNRRANQRELVVSHTFPYECLVSLPGSLWLETQEFVKHIRIHRLRRANTR